MAVIWPSARSTNHRYSLAAMATDAAPSPSVGDPGIRVRDELLHVRREFPGEHVGQGEVLEHRAQAGPDGDPDLLEILGGPGVAGRLRPEAPHLGQRAVQGADHVGDGDEPRVASEPVAALGAPLTG